MTPQNEQQVEQVRIFLESQRKVITRQQWETSYQSWQRGGNAWQMLRSGGTDIQTCLAWYQFIHKPGSREWRPTIIIDAVCRAACLSSTTTADKHRRATTAARQRKRRKQWADALQAAGWTESQFVTAVISGKVTLPVKQ